MKLSTCGIQAVAVWKLTPNFVVDVESYFNLSSDGKTSREATEDDKGYYKAAYSNGEKAVSVNAVYFLQKNNLSKFPITISFAK